MRRSDEHSAALEVLRRRHTGLQVAVLAVREAVRDARAVGVTWAEIGEVLGVSANEARVVLEPLV